jgi:hypothetical protein
MKKKKKSGKGKRLRARAVKDLTVSDARPVKGGSLMAAAATGKHIQKVVLEY